MARKIDTLIDNARIVTDGNITLGYVAIEGELIAEVGEGRAPAELTAEAGTTIDAAEKLLLPGCIDEHVHFRDPGLTHKADMASESRAAVAGGVTSFIDMPNTVPQTVTTATVYDKISHAAEVSVANYGFFIGATNSNFEELMNADYSRIAGVKLFLGSSTGNMLVDNENMLKRVFEQVPALIAVHAEDEGVIRRNRAAVIERHGENLPIEFHPVIRSHEACYNATSLAVELARRSGARLHVMHISTARELELFEPGPMEGKKITAETCPQYLLFTDEHYEMLGARIKCNPAIKRPADREALRRGVSDGRIDVIATDHAPHLPEEKNGTALTAVSGMPMVQFSLAVMLELVREGYFSIEQVVEKMSHNPARLFGIDRRGFIREGYYADMVLFDDECEPYTLTDEDVLSKCGWTPLAGMTLHGRPDITWVNGNVAYRYGIVFNARKGKALKFGTATK